MSGGSWIPGKLGRRSSLLGGDGRSFREAQDSPPWFRPSGSSTAAWCSPSKLAADPPMTQPYPDVTSSFLGQLGGAAPASPCKEPPKASSSTARVGNPIPDPKRAADCDGVRENSPVATEEYPEDSPASTQEYPEEHDPGDAPDARPAEAASAAAAQADFPCTQAYPESWLLSELGGVGRACAKGSESSANKASRSELQDPKDKPPAPSTFVDPALLDFPSTQAYAETWQFTERSSPGKAASACDGESGVRGTSRLSPEEPEDGRPAASALGGAAQVDFPCTQFYCELPPSIGLHSSTAAAQDKAPEQGTRGGDGAGCAGERCPPSPAAAAAAEHVSVSDDPIFPATQCYSADFGGLSTFGFAEKDASGTAAQAPGGDPGGVTPGCPAADAPSGCARNELDELMEALTPPGNVRSELDSLMQAPPPPGPKP
eukprot:CAMPEP_0175520788 /NCGR_PEP_ID=MMETSP0096-20121207/16687_1 /TAXON_ID=311494 /ORGANISM="Alexandrium monilatum, Strain CCMP3105" /LENGTH=430 /DNA_ID=CAMNT_0016823211 /DNA_START=94 /DNA_END=1384 /DNA_ORIENTATION=-